MTEKWKGDLNCNMKVGAIFMDLSKAFDTLNHRLILAKLKTYALQSNALSLIWVGGGSKFTPSPPSWFSLNNSENVKAVTLTFCSI